VLRRPGQVRADGADTEQTDCLPAQRPWICAPPVPDLLRMHTIQHAFFQEEQIPKHVLRHQLAEDAAGVGQYKTVWLSGIQKRFDARVYRLDPLHMGKAWQRFSNHLWFAKYNLSLRIVTYNGQIR
jgi:hypothetical protein